MTPRSVMAYTDILSVAPELNVGPELTPRLVPLSVLRLSPRVCSRVTEAYSCKSVSRERKLFKTLEQAYSLEQAEQDEMLSMSPEMRESGLESCFGRLDQKESRCVPVLLLAGSWEGGSEKGR